MLIPSSLHLTTALNWIPLTTPMLPADKCCASFAFLCMPSTSRHKPHWSPFLFLLPRHSFSHLSSTVHRILVSPFFTEITYLKFLITNTEWPASSSFCLKVPPCALQLWSPDQYLNWMWRVTWRMSIDSCSLMKTHFSPLEGTGKAFQNLSFSSASMSLRPFVGVGSHCETHLSFPLRRTWLTFSLPNSHTVPFIMLMKGPS